MYMQGAGLSTHGIVNALGMSSKFWKDIKREGKGEGLVKEKLDGNTPWCHEPPSVTIDMTVIPSETGTTK